MLTGKANELSLQHGTHVIDVRLQPLWQTCIHGVGRQMVGPSEAPRTAETPQLCQTILLAGWLIPCHASHVEQMLIVEVLITIKILTLSLAQPHFQVSGIALPRLGHQCRLDLQLCC